jgi:hypothetical protein
MTFGSNARKLVAGGMAGALLLALGFGLVLTHPLSPSATASPRPSFAAVTPDPDAPIFPVPAGSTLINATVEGTGASAYRLAAWTSGSSYSETVAFYSQLSDPRWQLAGDPSSMLNATNVVLNDSQGIFVSAAVEIDSTDPVRIAVRFLPKDAAHARSFIPGPTTKFGTLPPVTTLPDGFPADLAPSGATVVDAAKVGPTYWVVFAGTVNPAAYQNQISSVVEVTGTSTDSGATIIRFTLDGKPGQAIIDPASLTVRVEVSK